jgi:hypothetical protein
MNESLSASKEYTNLLLWIGVGCCLGLLVANPHPYVVLGSFSLLLGMVLIRYHEVGFYLILLSVFFADWFKELGLIPDQMTWVPDVILVILAFKAVFLSEGQPRTAKTWVAAPVLAFVLCGFISTLLNSEHMITAVLGFRQDLKFVVMFFLLISFDLEERFFRNMIRIFIVILLVQVPVALVKLTVYGQGEQAIGTYAVKGGTFSTILPLAAISIFLGFYLFDKPRFRYILACALFVLFSIVGGKRGFVFFGVGLSVFLFFQAGRRNLLRIALIAPFLAAGFLACVYFVPSLKPAFKDPRHLIDFPTSYSTAYTRDTGEADGRTAAVRVTHRMLKEETRSLLLGFGPGSASKSYFKEYEGKWADKIPIFYGETQWVLMSLEYGYVGTGLFLFLFIPIFVRNRRLFARLNDGYWKAVSFGFMGICLTYLMGFFYGEVFREDVLAFVFWFFAATMYWLADHRGFEATGVQANTEGDARQDRLAPQVGTL